MDKFNHTDYVANPRKYALFKTATIRNTIVNESGEVTAGTIVGLEYLGERRNQLYRRDEPIYRLNTGDVCYATNLADFCL